MAIRQDHTAARVVKTILTDWGQSTWAAFWGKEDLAKKEQIRRIVFVPSPSSVEMPRTAGGFPLEVDGEMTRSSDAAVRVENHECHLFGENEEVVDKAFDAFIASAKRVLEQHVIFGEYEWDPSALADRGACIVFAVAFRLPAPAERAPLIPITAELHQCGITDDIETVTGETE